MKTILIHPQDIVANTIYMNDNQGRHDLLGQILFTGYGVIIPPKTRTPQDLEQSVHPFVTIVRRYTKSNTSLTLSLLALGNLSGKRQVIEANKLLAPYKIRLVTEQELETTIPQPLPEATECGMCGELVECCMCDELENDE